MLVSMSSCPFCLSGTNTSCFATYDDGYHCFTCGKSKRGGDYSFKKLQTTASVYGIKLPHVTTNIKKYPLWAQEFLYKSYISQELINKYSIYYSEELDSLIFPIYTIDKSLVFYQTRGKDKQIKTYGDKDNQPTFKQHDATSCVVVEDFISSVRLNNNNNNTHCLFGTNATRQACESLIQSFTEIIIWLDGDEAGKAGADKLLIRLEEAENKINNKKPFLMSEKRIITIITTEKDPKCYSDFELHNVLKRGSLCD